MTNTATIEAIDLAAYDWAPCCEIVSIVHHPDAEDDVNPCNRPATHVIEVRHCTPYRLFACAVCIQGATPNGWTCRRCDGRCPEPVVIGKAA